MSEKRQPQHPESFDIGDVYFVLFRRKWLILSFCVLGFVAAGVISILRPAQYESEAKLYIQFVQGVTSKVDQPGGNSIAVDPTGPGMNIALTEMEILKSLDVVEQVVTNIGAERILATWGGGEDTNKAAGVILANLAMDEVPKTPNILHVTMQHPDPDVARDILRSLVDFYVRKSGDLHTVQIPEEQIVTEALQISQELAKVDEQLSSANQKAGIISSFDETAKELSDRYSKTQSALDEAQAQLSETGASLKTTNSGNATAGAATNAPVSVPESVVRDYRSKLANLERARKELDQVEYETPENSPLREAPKKRLESIESAKLALEKQYPELPNLVAPVMESASSQVPNAFDALSQSIAAARISSKIATLSSQLVDIKNQQARLESQRSVIIDLQNTRSFKQDYLKHLREKQEVAGNSSNPEFAEGIKYNTHPTPAVKKRAKQVKKMMMGALAGGMLGGLALAFLLEMVVDRSVRRPGEFETKLHLPLFISIPDLAQNGKHNGKNQDALLAANNRKLLNASNSTALVTANGTNGAGGAVELPVWDPQHGMHRFCAGLRDRLIVNFEVRNLSHNPKLVGVTSCNRGAGVSSVAAGLAASMSETGDGNVLLVDMRGDQGAAQHFYKGKPASGVDAALASETREGAFVQENLYVAGDADETEIPTALSKRFASLMPKLKASDYDYIIFDMPPVSQTSVTARLSGLMDMVLLVVEAEKTQRDSVKRATALLNESKANVSTVLNKVHNYVPTRLHQEYLDDEA